MGANNGLEVPRGDILAGAEASTPPLAAGPRAYRTIEFDGTEQEIDLSGLLGHPFESYPAIVCLRARTESAFLSVSGTPRGSNAWTVSADALDCVELTPAEGKAYLWFAAESRYIQLVGSGAGVLELYVSMPVAGGQRP